MFHTNLHCYTNRECVCALRWLYTEPVLVKFSLIKRVTFTVAVWNFAGENWMSIGLAKGWKNVSYADSVHVQVATQNSICCLRMWYSPKWRQGGDELLNKVFFFFFVHKKYSRSFVRLRLNPWCHINYFTDVFATFLDLDRGNYITVYGRVRELSEFIKNISICVLKMNGGLTGLERHEGE